jgi:hypothetical protein
LASPSLRGQDDAIAWLEVLRQISHLLHCPDRLVADHLSQGCRQSDRFDQGGHRWCTAAAVANAIYNATGVRLRNYPITLDKLIDRLPEVG